VEYLNIHKVKKGEKVYFELREGNKFIRHIGNEQALKVFERDVEIGKEALRYLTKRPYLSPKSCLSIIAEGKKADLGKIIIPDKVYKTIVIDPPWQVEKILRDERPNQTEFDYPTMDIDEIKALPVKRLADQTGCHIYLWTTQKYLPLAYDILKAWDVDYQCLMTWVKNVGFTPFSFMYSTEHCLFGHYGSLPLLQMGKRLDFQAKVREHSRKPDEFYNLVKEVSPEPRLDWFSREKREGYDQLGNEVGKFGI
jgi:N6-adenosine-specific RNA methylase IME4